MAPLNSVQGGVAVLGRVHRDVEKRSGIGWVRGHTDSVHDGVVYRGGYDAATLMEALAR